MSHRVPKRATKGERAYISDLERASAFDLVDHGRARILSPEQYPEPLRRFLDRERAMIHIKLTPTLKRKLEARSRETGRPVDELARTWIKQGIARETG